MLSEKVRPPCRRFSSASSGMAWEALSAAMRRCPVTSVRTPLRSAFASSSAANRRVVISTSLWPSGVSDTARPCRSKRRAPCASSSARTWAEIVGWLTCPARAALVKLPACATR